MALKMVNVGNDKTNENETEIKTRKQENSKALVLSKTSLRSLLSIFSFQARKQQMSKRKGKVQRE
jgi:hypothetical protein